MDNGDREVRIRYFLDVAFNWDRVAADPNTNRYELDHYIYREINSNNRPYTTYRQFMGSDDPEFRDRFRIRAYNIGPTGPVVTAASVRFRAATTGGGNNNNPIDPDDETRRVFDVSITSLPNLHVSHPFGMGLERWNLNIDGISSGFDDTDFVRPGKYLMGARLTVTGPNPVSPTSSTTKEFAFDPEWVVNPGNI